MPAEFRWHVKTIKPDGDVTYPHWIQQCCSIDPNKPRPDDLCKLNRKVLAVGRVALNAACKGSNAPITMV